MKIFISIIGARPQFIKTALLSCELRKYFKEIVVHTGQHYDLNMSDIFFKDLKLPKVDYNLEVGSDTQGRQTARMLERIEAVLFKEKPNLVIIFGDTNSTVAGALAASKLHIPVAHVEAGLRSYNREMPEEINRIVSDHISELLFAPTENAVNILKGEGIIKGVSNVGDVMNDIQQREIKNQKLKSYLPKGKILEKYNLKSKTYILATVHRQENSDKKENLRNIFKAFEQIPDIVFYPIHPRTRKMIKQYGWEKWVAKIPNLRLVEPIGYKEMIQLEANAKLILTDSGGVQKEAYIARVPCVTLRKETEWIETTASGWNRLAGTDTSKIVHLAKHFPKPKNHPNFLGDGKAYLKITKIIRKFLN